MKKLFAIAVVGLMVAFSSNAFASDSDSNNDNTEFVIESAHVDAVAFEFVPVVTEFTFNVETEQVSYDFQSADVSVNSASVGEDFEFAVNTEGLYTSNLKFDIPIDDGYSTNIDKFTLNEPIPNLTEFTLSDNKPIPNLTEFTFSVNNFTLNEPIPNLTEYVTNYNEIYGYASPKLVKDIATNVGKFTKYNL